MLEEGKLIVKFYIDLTRQMVSLDNSNEKMPLAEFFQRFVSEETLGISNTKYNYSKFCQMIDTSKNLKPDDGEMASYGSDDGTYIVRFIIQKIENEDKAFCCIYKVKFSSNESQELKKDYLTGVLSRGAFIHECEEDLINKVGNNYLIVIDLDNFKDANDTFGHTIGDEYLKNIAGRICEIGGENHLVGRYGGDEFVMYVRNIDEEKLYTLIDELLSIEFKYSEKSRTAQLKISCSLGIAKVNDNEVDFAKIFERVDHALYKSKHLGRNVASFSSGEVVRRKNDNIKKKFSIKNEFYFNKHQRNSKLFRKELAQKRYSNIIIALSTIVALVFVITFIGSYYSRRFTKNSRNEAQSIMSDISDQICSNISYNINNWISQLLVAEKLISTIEQNSETYDELLDQYLKVLESQFNFSKIGLLLESGDLFFSGAEEYNVSSSELAKYVIVDNKSFIGTIYMNYVGEMIVFAVPYGNNMGFRSSGSLEYRSISGVVGMISVKDFSALLSSSAFNGTSFFTLVKSDGTTITTNGSVEISGLTKNNNLYNALEKYIGNEETDKTILNIKNLKTDVFDMTIDGIDYISYYSPTSVGDWYLFITVPSNVILNDIISVFNSTERMIYVLLVSVSIIIILLTTLLNTQKSKTQLLVYLDPVTNDINFDRFKVDANTLITASDKDTYSLVYINIKHFKYLTEQIGSEKSDQIVKSIFDIIENQLKPNELVSHVFADRYIVLLKEFDDEVIKERLINLSNSIKTSFDTNGIIEINVTQGVYKINSKSTTINAAADRAHVAQLAVKDVYGSDGINFFDETWLKNDAEIVDIEQRQDVALKENQLHVFYQLKRNIFKDNWCGSEALIRWIDPIKGMISPGKFIPLFEKNGFVIKLDLFVFENVCKNISRMIDDGITPLRVSVNVSRSHLMHKNFLDEYFKLMEKYNVPPKYIEFELTESLVMENSEILVEIINQIHKFGCTCSIDDFGSGYSSLNMLKEFDFDVIKLDQVFFRGSNGFDDKAKKIVHSVIELCHTLNKTIVAEGVENKEIVNYLKKEKCAIIQGYYFSKPVPYEDYMTQVKKQSEEEKNKINDK